MIKIHDVVQVIKEALGDIPTGENEVILCEIESNNNEIFVKFTHDDLTENEFVISISLKK